MLDKKDLRRFFGHLKPHRSGLILAFFCVLVGAALEPILPALLQPLLDSTVAKGGKGTGYPAWVVPVIIVALFAVRGAVGYVAQYAAAWSTNGMVNDLRKQMFARVLNAHPDLFRRQSYSKLINTISQESQMAVNALVVAGQTFVKESLTLVALMAYLFWANWQLTLVNLLVLPVVVVIIRRIGKRLDRFARQQLEGIDAMTYVVEENVQANRIVRLHGDQPAQTQRFAAASNFLRGRLMRSVAAAAAINPLTQVATAVALAVIVSIALRQSQDGTLSVGAFAAYLSAMVMTVPRAKALGDVYPALQRGAISLGRIYQLLDEPLEADTGTHRVERATGRIELRDVRKVYDPAARPALDGVSLDISPGETVALVGPSGSGKSTLVSLLPRFVDADGGTLLLDGVPLADWSLHSLREQMALVSQDVVLFNDTVQANVVLGHAVDEQRVRDALVNANLWEHVQSLPQGVHSVIGHNGTSLSGGQRQRLAIARALYRDAPVLLLDEATSALDTESERAIQQALERLTRGRTTLIVAHRLSTIQHADRIVVLAEGRIVEQGRYADLVAAGGAFSRLIAAQAELLPAADNT